MLNTKKIHFLGIFIYLFFQINFLFGQTVPPAPTGLRVTATECGKISLAWDDYGLGIEETRYSIYKSDAENGFYSYIGTVDANILSFADRGLSSNFNPNQNYYYKITAYFQHLETAFSTTISSSFSCPTPTGLTVNSSNCGEIELHWNDFGNLANETGYNIYRSQGNNVGFGFIGQVGANIVDFIDNTSRQGGVIYNYKIEGSFNNSYYTVSPSSLPQSITYNCDSPTNFRISSTSCGRIELNWDDFQSNLIETSYQIYRSDNPTYNFELIKTLAPNTLTYSDTSYLFYNKPYYYQIKANFANNISSSLSTTINSSFTCQTPSNLQVINSDCGNINLTWNDLIDETGYVISVYSNKYPDLKYEIGQVGPNINSFSAKGHYFGEDFYSKSGEIYKYVVTGKYFHTFTDISNIVQSSFVCPSPPNPSLVSSTCGNITISWEDFPNSINESGYVIFVSTAPSGHFSRIGTVNSNVLSFTYSNNLQSGINYYFKIAGLFNTNITDLSNSVSAITNCEIPTGLSVSNIGCDKLTLTWSATQNATGYRIYRSENIFDGKYDYYTQINANNTSYELNIQQGKSYFYKIKAIFGTANSNFSNFVGPFVADCSNFPIPTGLKIIAKQCGSITLAWDDIPQPFNEISYQLTRYRPTEDGFSNYEYSTVSIDPNTLNHTDTRPIFNNNYLYYYKISAIYNGVIRESEAVSTKMECEATSQLTVSNGTNCNGINLYWTDFGPNFQELSYEIYRAENSEYAALGYFVKIKELPAGTLSYIDNNPSDFDLPIESNLHFYKIIARNANTVLESNVASGKYTCGSNILLTSTNDCNKITLNWVDNEPNIANNGFIIFIESSKNPGKFYQWHKVGINVNTYQIDQYISANQNYNFKIAKIIGGITTSMSNASSQSINCYNQPILSIESTDCGRISLNINTNSNEIVPNGYQIFRSIDGPNGYLQLIARGNEVPNVYHDVASYYSPINSNFANILEVNRTYQYRVVLNYGGVEVGYNTFITGSFSCSALTPISGVNIETITCNTVKLAWNSVGFEGKNGFVYQIYKSINGINGEYSYVNSWNDYYSFPHFYVLNNLVSGQSSFYKVQYFLDGIASKMSEPIEVVYNSKILSTYKSGLWTDPTVWSCLRVPNISDNVIINNGHIISIGDNIIGNCKNIENNGGLIFSVGSELKLNLP